MIKRKPQAKAAMLIFLLTASCTALSAEALRSADLGAQRPSWQSVIGGEAVAQIAETSYGFCVPSDGRLVSACTYSGGVMWQRSVKGKPSAQFSAWNDFVIAVTDKSKLNFINPSGVTVWQEDCGFEVKAPPLSGWDGRIFAIGDTAVSCYGLAGGKKWTRKIPQASRLPAGEFSDGSILVFLSQLSGGKTQALRISPFGEILEEITFAGQILSSASCPDGVLMSFTDGSAGLCRINNGDAVSQWVVHPDREKFNAVIPGAKSSAFISSPSKGMSQACIIDNATGKQTGIFSIGAIDSQSLRYTRSTAQGFFAADSSRAVEFSCDGTVFWEAKLPAKNRWNFIKYTDKNQILLCMKDWTLNSYTMSQEVGNSFAGEISLKSYTSPSSSAQKYDGVTYSFIPLSRMEEIRDSFIKGGCAEKEKDMLSQLQEAAGEYLEELSSEASSRRGKKSYFSGNPVYTQVFIQAMSLSQTDTFTSSMARMLELEKDPLLLNILIQEAGTMGYDRRGEILSAFIAISGRLTKKDSAASKLLCDSTYKIVAFMGRPALYRQGKQILSQLMFPQYPKETRDYARQTLEKIISLEL